MINVSSSASRQFWEIPVLYEDDHLLAIDKPAGLAVVAQPADPEPIGLMELLHDAIKEKKPWTQQRGLTYLKQAHRLDTEASGVLLLAKNKPVLVQLSNLFGEPKPHRQYLALAQGTPLTDQFESDARIAPHSARPDLMKVDSRRGKRSHTVFQVRERFTGFVLLECQPTTDREQQVRVHLRYAGLPVAGDVAYGGKPIRLSRIKQGYRSKADAVERPLMARAAIHAEKLALPHPVTGEPLVIVAPLPNDFIVTLKYLRRFAHGT